MPFISICIPAYKRPEYLKRLLDSICVQNYTDYEVIVTDDSPDDTVEKICSLYPQIQDLRYYKNEKPLGTPANWNAAIDLAKGKWIKLMHDDDWFANSNSLQQFAECARANSEAFIFSAYTNVFENTEKETTMFADRFRMGQLLKDPVSILSKNIIGHPSTTLCRNNGACLYDEQLKWLVDVEMYIRALKRNKAVYIPAALVKVGMSDSQVTALVKNRPGVEIPEHLYFLKKLGSNVLKNALAYDYFWRFIRNFDIQQPEQLTQYAQNDELPFIIRSMIAMQAKIPRSLLKNGVFSKLLMACHYMRNRNMIDR